MDVEQQYRIDILYSLFNTGESVDDMIRSFEMDRYPEIEIKVYEEIAKEFIFITDIYTFNKNQKLELIKTLELLTIYEKNRVKSLHKTKYIPIQQLHTIIRKSNLRVKPFTGWQRNSRQLFSILFT